MPEGERRLSLQRAILRALYNNRRNREQVAPARAASTAGAARAAPILREANAEDLLAGAVCRFCFEGGPKRLVAPCSCSGSQAWIHEACLVRWQRVAGASGPPGRNAVCNVCQTTFAIAPPEPPPMPSARAGMLLVASPNLGGSFEQSVILLCEVNAHGAHGVIIVRAYSVLERALTPGREPRALPDAASAIILAPHASPAEPLPQL